MIKPSTYISWCSASYYTTGAATGYPTKFYDPLGPTEGSIPGQGVVAQFYNYNQHHLGNWSEWVYNGSATADIDTHIVETDIDGAINIVSANVGGVAGATTPAMVVINNSGHSPYAGSFTNVSGGFAIIGTSNGNQTSIRGITTSTGSAASGLQGINISGGPGYGVHGYTTSDGTGSFSESTSGLAHKITSTTGKGLLINSTSGQLIDGITGNALGAYIETTNTDGIAIRGNAGQSGASANAVGVLGEGSADATGVYGTAEDGHGLVAQNTGTVRSPFKVFTSVNDPSSITQGSVWVNSTYDRIGFAENDSGERTYLWATKDGLTKAFNRAYYAGVSLSITALTTNVVSITVTNPASTDGYVELDLAFTARSSYAGVGNTQTIGFGLWDATLSGSVENYSQIIPDTDLLIDSNILRTVRYQVPAAGSRTIRADFYHTALQNYTIANISLKAIGIFDSATGL